jgi:hypothetical protein
MQNVWHLYSSFAIVSGSKIFPIDPLLVVSTYPAQQLLSYSWVLVLLGLSPNPLSGIMGSGGMWCPATVISRCYDAKHVFALFHALVSTTVCVEWLNTFLSVLVHQAMWWFSTLRFWTTATTDVRNHEPAKWWHIVSSSTFGFYEWTRTHLPRSLNRLMMLCLSFAVTLPSMWKNSCSRAQPNHASNIFSSNMSGSRFWQKMSIFSSLHSSQLCRTLRRFITNLVFTPLAGSSANISCRWMSRAFRQCGVRVGKVGMSVCT